MTRKEAEDRVRHIIFMEPATQDEKIKIITDLVTGTFGNEIIECNKKQALTFYDHLLDLVEKERMSERFSEWCELEREYISLVGEKHFTEYYKSK